MIPGRNMPTAAAMIGGLASYAASFGQVYTLTSIPRHFTFFSPSSRPWLGFSLS
jgi:hypothetical protein